MIKVTHGIASREPIPAILPPDPSALADLSWTHESLGLHGCAWWPEEDQTPELDDDEVLDGTETLTPDAARKVVVVTRGVRHMTAEEIRERWLQASPVPHAISTRQGQLFLLSVGLLDDAEALMASIANPMERRAAQIEFASPVWERSSTFLIRMWTDLGGTEESLDDAFRTAIAL